MLYHEVTYEEQRHRRAARLRAVVALALACLVAWFALGWAQQLAREQGATALRDSVIQAALQCCAVEGSYPTSLSYLEEHYGLVVNERDYQVSYEWLGDNIAPSVVVRAR